MRNREDSKERRNLSVVGGECDTDGSDNEASLKITLMEESSLENRGKASRVEENCVHDTRGTESHSHRHGSESGALSCLKREDTL